MRSTRCARIMASTTRAAKKSKRLDLDHTLVGYELTAGERPDHLVLMLDTHADNEGSMRPEIFAFCC